VRKPGNIALNKDGKANRDSEFISIGTLTRLHYLGRVEVSTIFLPLIPLEVGGGSPGGDE